jgi:hypothetical protein
MATTIILAWPSFNVDLNQVNIYFRGNLSSNYNGLVATVQQLAVYFTTDYSTADGNAVTTYWSSLTSTSFNPTETEQIQAAIQAAMTFGQQLIVQYSAQNVAAGITQAGQTQAVANYLGPMINYLITGSLYAAIDQINTYIADTSSTKQGLSPYVTNDILYAYLNEIQTFLKITLTPNPGP